MAPKTIQRQKLQRAEIAKAPREWKALGQKALAAAEKSGDRRAQGLKSALGNGRIEQTLRTLGIICEQDLLREFPLKS